LRQSATRTYSNPHSQPFSRFRFAHRSEKKTHCQLEIDISYKEVIARQSEGEWNKIAPLRVLSFDIECQGRKGYFPEAERDPVIQIANVVSIYGQAEPVVKNVFTLKGCLPIVGTQVITSEKEVRMDKMGERHGNGTKYDQHWVSDRG
jgi:DNA polymerase delta subunit 1